MNIENFKCQEDCNVFGYYKCQWQIYGSDSVEYSWCDNGNYCGCAIICTKGPYKGETCKGTCNVGLCCAKDKKSTCAGGEDTAHYGIYREGLCEKAGCAIAVSSLWLSFIALLNLVFIQTMRMKGFIL